jgi:hypothetical protein
MSLRASGKLNAAGLECLAIGQQTICEIALSKIVGAADAA